MYLVMVSGGKCFFSVLVTHSPTHESRFVTHCQLQSLLARIDMRMFNFGNLKILVLLECAIIITQSKNYYNLKKGNESKIQCLLKNNTPKNACK